MGELQILDLGLSNECCKNRHEIITIDHKTCVQIARFYQCINSGSSPNLNKPLSSKNYGEEIRSEFSNSLFSEFREYKERERIELPELKVFCTISGIPNDISITDI